MKKAFKWILAGIVAIGCVGAGVYYFLKPLAVDTVKLSPSEAELYFTEQGFVTADKTVQVFPPVPGKILSVNVIEEQSVNEGDIICIIDSSGLEYEIAQLQSGIDGYEAQKQSLDLEEQKQKDSLVYNAQSLRSQLDSLAAQQAGSDLGKEEQLKYQDIIIEQSRKNLEVAKSELERGEKLYANGLITENEYEQLQNAVTASKNALESQEQQLSLINSGQDSNDYYESAKASLEAQIRGLESSISKSYTSASKKYYDSLINAAMENIQSLKDKIADCSIKAPVSGKITELGVLSSNIASQAAPVCVITRENACDVEVFVSTKDIDAVDIGATVQLIAKRQQGDVTLNGTVTEKSSEAELRMSALGIEERRVKVTISQENNGIITLGPGFDLDVKFVTYRGENKLCVPKTAVFQDTKSGDDCVWAVINGSAEQRRIKTGVELRTDYVIESGLSSGDIIVKDAYADGLKQGVKIAVE